VRFDFVPLLVNDPAQLPLHCLESVMDHFGDRLVCTVVHLFFVGHQLVSRRYRHIDATAIRISFLMGVIGLLDRDVATVDVIAKSFEPRRVLENEIVDVVGFGEAAIGDFDGQLHSWLKKLYAFMLMAREQKN
jgi:hypothetical protein